MTDPVRDNVLKLAELERKRFTKSRKPWNWRSFAVGLIAAGLFVAASGKAKGEFQREVPAWWVGPALCVKSHEGGWRSNTGNGYYGGFQMDLTFQRHHGGWMLKHFGTADHWPPRAQMVIAYRGWRSQGWGAWPNTSRMCGLR